MAVEIHYDPDADNARISLSGERVGRTGEVAPGIAIEYDLDGRIAGVRIARAQHVLPKRVLVEAELRQDALARDHVESGGRFDAITGHWQ